EWLIHYGYLPPADPTTGQLQTWEAVTTALRVMQRFAGIAETGILDNATLSLIRMPRCALPDITPNFPSELSLKERARKKRVKSYPRRARLSREMMRVLIYYALKVWSEAIPLTFHEVGSHTADISVEFLQLDHHDSYPFDGPGGMVAHAFFPRDPQRAGTVHFDGDEEWTFRSPGSKVFHSTEKQDVTTPLPSLLSLSHNFPAVRLGKGFPDRCTSNIDAVAQIRGETFFFKGYRHLTSPQPVLTTRFWRGLPSALHKVDAVYERPADHRILFFSVISVVHTILFLSLSPFLTQGPLYWVFKDNGVEEGYPRPITDFGLPQGGISGAFSWPSDQKTYFFKGDLHWCYDETTRHIEEASPLLQESWEQFSSSVDSVLSESDGTLYVFKGQQYWKFDQETLQLQAGYPRSIATDWLDCTVEPLRIMPTSPSLGVKLPPNFRGPQLKIEERVCFCAAFCAISSTLLNVLPWALLTLQGLA
ncbi:Matrix metalloproteinase-17, partial [Ophiophagus hannah]